MNNFEKKEAATMPLEGLNDLMRVLDEKFSRLEADLSALKINSKKLLNSHEMAAWLGISKSKLDKLSCARKIPFFKMPGSSLRIYEVDEVARWMTSDGNHVRAYTDDDIIELQRKAGEYMRELR